MRVVKSDPIASQLYPALPSIAPSAKPEYDNCVKIATEASLKEMIAPGCLVVLSPIVFGIFFGKEALAGLLPGAMTSGVQMAISASNTGGAWDNAKKYIESGGLEGHAKGSEVCRRLARPTRTHTDICLPLSMAASHHYVPLMSTRMA